MKPAKRKINWAVLGLLVMILIIVAIAWGQVQSTTLADPVAISQECISCHAMEQQATAWECSEHSSAACTACHADTGFKGWVGIQVAKWQMTRAEKNGTGVVHLETGIAEVPNERCIACHAREMPWVMQDLEPPQLDEKGEPIRVARDELQFLPGQAGHDVHLAGENPLLCIDCHFDVTHGPQNSTAEQVANMHAACLDCHAEQSVAVTVRNSVACSACHVELDKVTPPDHKSVAFREEHGKAAVTDINSCQQCHLNPGIGKQVAFGQQGLKPVANVTAASPAEPLPPSFDVKFPAGSLEVPPGMEDNCASCHGTTMPHPEGWLTQHTSGFAEKPQLCASCHGSTQTGFDMAVVGNPRTLPTTDPTCTGCHTQPMPHPDTWDADHPEAAKAAPATCDQCHSPKNAANPTADHSRTDFCLDCHSDRYSHPVGWIAQHADAVERYNGNQAAAGCTQCHTPTVNSCTTCHAGGVGNTDWHPDNWVGDHSTSLASYGNSAVAAGCIECHTKTFNSCTTCHTDGVGKTQWHPTDWIGDHSDALSSFGNNATTAGCTDCHTETFNACAACHTGGVKTPQQWHPDDFVATHDTTLAAYNDDPASANCTTCHTATFNSCTACHTDGLDKTQQWHPPFWWVSHARTTNDQNKATCASCHDYVQPSCTQCHTDP